VTKDVPKVYNPDVVLKADSWLTVQVNPTSNPDEYPIKLPITGGKGYV
jgi:hypothetical protein